MTSLRQKLIEYIKLHKQVHFRDIEKYAENNGYKAYTATRRLQEVRDPKDLAHYDPEIGTIEENSTIKFYVYKPGQIRENTALPDKSTAQEKTPRINAFTASQVANCCTSFVIFDGIHSRDCQQHPKNIVHKLPTAPPSLF